ncbi:hypothetical protein TKK_0013798 [Trichogramma kaykai]
MDFALDFQYFEKPGGSIFIAELAILSLTTEQSSTHLFQSDISFQRLNEKYKIKNKKLQEFHGISLLEDFNGSRQEQIARGEESHLTNKSLERFDWKCSKLFIESSSSCSEHEPREITAWFLRFRLMESRPTPTKVVTGKPRPAYASISVIIKDRYNEIIVELLTNGVRD